jgi:hypothetical protein
MRSALSAEVPLVVAVNTANASRKAAVMSAAPTAQGREERRTNILEKSHHLLVIVCSHRWCPADKRRAGLVLLVQLGRLNVVDTSKQ